MGKSAQYPLQIWLPDAMAGPTPISALIHAATMVAAGVYVVARLYPVFLVTPAALWILGVVACVTMLASALAAFAQTDLKRILAYSTISQLAMMVAALAVGGRAAGIFHLLVSWTFTILKAAIVVMVISSWLPISPYSKWVSWSYRLSTPILAPLRRVVPNLGGLDITPILAYILLNIIESFLYRLM